MTQPIEPEDPRDAEHPLDALLSPRTHRIVLFVYAAVMLIAGLWLLSEPAPAPAPEHSRGSTP